MKLHYVEVVFNLQRQHESTLTSSIINIVPATSQAESTVPKTTRHLSYLYKWATSNKARIDAVDEYI